jgi:hypothetical protein
MEQILCADGFNAIHAKALWRALFYTLQAYSNLTSAVAP